MYSLPAKAPPPPHHSWVETLDGSFTLFSENYQEACHSQTGAKEETILHYLNGCQISEMARQHDPLNILEVGFGLGLGFLTTREFLAPTDSWKFFSLEIDEALVEWFRLQNPQLNLQWAMENNLKILSGENLTVLVGDARQTLPHFLTTHCLKFHAIYQDAFSPGRNPILWTREWFDLLKEASCPDVILSTYSASVSIRKSLSLAGWSLHPGEGFGKKRRSTRATLTGKTDPAILFELERSPVPALTDANIKSRVDPCLQ